MSCQSLDKLRQGVRFGQPTAVYNFECDRDQIFDLIFQIRRVRVGPHIGPDDSESQLIQLPDCIDCWRIPPEA